MPITWKEQVRGKPGEVREWKTHKGLVMTGPITRHDVRVMSDVWADQTYCLVWNPEKEEVEEVTLYTHFELCHKRGNPVIDCPPEILRDWKQKVEEDEEARLAADQERLQEEREEESRKILCPFKKGQRVIVSNKRSRKVAPGTEGVIGWLDNKHEPTRIGFDDDEGERHWTAVSNCTVLYPGLKLGEKPEGGWAALRQQHMEAMESWKRDLPKRGEEATIIQSGLRVEIKWVSDARVGVLPVGQKKGKYSWFSPWELTLHREEGDFTPTRPPVARAIPEGRENPLKDLPHPFNTIALVTDNTVTGTWKAFDQEGDFVMDLTEKAAQNLRSLLEAQ